MPKIAAYPPIETRLLDSAPESGNGLHIWLIKGARECQRSGVRIENAFALIAATVVARGGEIREHDINQAISKAYSTPWTGVAYTPRAKSEYDPAKLERIANR